MPTKPGVAIKYTKEVLVRLVSCSRSWSDLCRNAGIKTTGATPGRLKKLAILYGISTDHFVKYGRTIPYSRSNILDICQNEKSGPRIRTALIESGVPDLCSICGQAPEWNGMPLTLQVDHINGNRLDNRPTNVRIVCPNCHTQTSNWGFKNYASTSG